MDPFERKFGDFSPLRMVQNARELRAMIKYYFVITAGLQICDVTNTRIPTKDVWIITLTSACRLSPDEASKHNMEAPHKEAMVRVPNDVREAYHDAMERGEGHD